MCVKIGMKTAFTASVSLLASLLVPLTFCDSGFMCEVGDAGALDSRCSSTSATG